MENPRSFKIRLLQSAQFFFIASIAFYAEEWFNNGRKSQRRKLMNEWLIATGGGHIAAIIAVAAVFLDARLLGAIFVKATGLKIRHPVLFPVVSLIIGMDILIGLAFFAGLFGLFSSPLVKYAMFAISAISLADIARSLGATRSSVGKHMRRNYIFLLLFLATARDSGWSKGGMRRVSPTSSSLLMPALP